MYVTLLYYRTFSHPYPDDYYVLGVYTRMCMQFLHLRVVCVWFVHLRETSTNTCFALMLFVRIFPGILGILFRRFFRRFSYAQLMLTFPSTFLSGTIIWHTFGALWLETGACDLKVTSNARRVASGLATPTVPPLKQAPPASPPTYRK